MKKVIYSLLIVLGVIILSGCGKEIDFSKTNHIVCKKTEVNASDTTSTTMTFSYDKNEKLSWFKIESDTVYNNNMSKEAIEITEKTMKLISKTIGAGFKSEIGENRLYISFNGNVKALKLLMKQLNKNYKDDLVSGDTKQEALTDLTKEGYTCEDIKK